MIDCSLIHHLLSFASQKTRKISFFFCFSWGNSKLQSNINFPTCQASALVLVSTTVRKIMQHPAEEWRSTRAARKSRHSLLFLFTFRSPWNVERFLGVSKKKRFKMFLLELTSMLTDVWQHRRTQQNLGFDSTCLPAAPDLQTQEEQLFWSLTAYFFRIFERRPALWGSTGNTEVKAEPLLWLRFSRAELWPPWDLLCSLAHAEALHHLFPLRSVILHLSCQICPRWGL